MNENKRLRRKNTSLLKSIGEQFAQLRNARGETQETITYHTGMNIGLYEKGKSNMSISTLDALCMYLGLSLEEFFKDLKYER